MSEILPGQRTTARCTRCKDTTGHIIVAVVGDEILKVECVACKSIHKYYPAEKATKEKEVKPKRIAQGQDREKVVKQASAAVSKTVSKKNEKIKQSDLAKEQAWHQAINKSLASTKEYSFEAVFQKNDLVEHKLFGQGVVQDLIAPNKVSILFIDGLKILRCASFA